MLSANPTVFRAYILCYKNLGLNIEKSIAYSHNRAGAVALFVFKLTKIITSQKLKTKLTVDIVYILKIHGYINIYKS